ncbi:hypothetical protein DYB26_014731 [Aphanomyces astaci]|uniref:Uncharacterized protein n=1 Tax=Aphanomyces astaci TaxID=112090 RepID=A0A397F9H0_APHAT|nr:hypothetical protein DYB31_012698 [Aphanomyces astaci]RHZ39670.1 hypothetical protein DYB26_014731 [Aphanomyces astaci]
MNALQTRLTELSDKRRKTDDGLLWCYICKKKGNHEAKGHPGYDANYVNKRAATPTSTLRNTITSSPHVRLLRSGYQLAHQDLKKTTYVHRFNGHELHFALSHSLYVLQDVAPRAAAERINATTLATDKALDPPSDAKLRRWHNKLNHTDMRQVAKIIQPILLPGIDSSTTNHICEGVPKVK